MNDQQHLLFKGPKHLDYTPSTNDQFLHLLALAGLRGIGFLTLRALYDEFRAFSPVWEATPEQLRAVFSKAKVSVSLIPELLKNQSELIRSARVEHERLRQHGIELVLSSDQRFPASLWDLDDPPRWLFAQGDLSLLSVPSVGVVGTRSPTPTGLEVARRVGGLIAELGIPVVSGLAEGIDAKAHEAALDHGGRAIGVLGNGMNIVFPAATAHIREKIQRTGGLIVTEYLPYEQYNRQRFLQRNRIQAALSRILIPIQGARKSGTAVTVDFARKLNRHIIGVTLGSLEHIPQNELVEYLSEIGSSVFDITADTAALAGLLQQYANPQFASKSSRFYGVVQEFERAISQYSITDAEVRDLLKWLSDIWRMRRDRGGN